jgi:hypothetical protein
LPNDKQAPKELKVTDKRIFTSDGEIRDEFKKEIRPAEPGAAPPAPPPAEAKPEPPRSQQPQPSQHERRQRAEPPPGEERRRTMQDRLQNPETPFSNFIAGLVMQAYMSLGMLRDPYNPQGRVDAGAARQMIELITLLRDKTQGNLTADEEDFLESAIGELKLAFVQRTKSI